MLLGLFEYYMRRSLVWHAHLQNRKERGYRRFVQRMHLINLFVRPVNLYRYIYSCFRVEFSLTYLIFIERLQVPPGLSLPMLPTIRPRSPGTVLLTLERFHASTIVHPRVSTIQINYYY